MLFKTYSKKIQIFFLATASLIIIVESECYYLCLYSKSIFFSYKLYLSLMSFFRFWKECSCWCLFTMSTIMLLIMGMLILNDLSLLSKNQGMLELITNTPIPQLNCIQICQSWFSMESGMQCCDRYNMNVCSAKQQCKIDYVKKTQTVIQIIQNDKFHETMVAGICVLILVMVACRKRWHIISQQSSQIESAKLRQLVKQVIQQLRKQKMIEGTPHFGAEEIKSQVTDFNGFQKNRSNVLLMVSQKILSSHLSKETQTTIH